MARKAGQVIGSGPRICLARVCMCMPAVIRLPKNPDLRLSVNGLFSDADLSRFRWPESDDFAERLRLRKRRRGLKG
jgi:hypothetical protein